MIKQLPTKVKTYNLINLPIGIDFPYFSQTLQPTRTNNMTIDIIGAGIGGLTTAIALEQKGINIRIFERSEQIKAVGAGIILASNAMQVYEKLGLRKIIEENGNPISLMNITNSKLKPLSKIDLSYFEQKHNIKNIAICRLAL